MNIKRGFVLAVGLVLAAGCGGDGGGDDIGDAVGDGGPDGGTASVRVHVTDYFGQPVGGAQVNLCAVTDPSQVGASCTPFAATDAEGNVAFEDVPAGRAQLCAFSPTRGGASCDENVSISPGGTVTLNLRLEPNPDNPATAAVLEARVDEDGLSPDGRTLDIVIRVAVTEPPPLGSWFDEDPVWVEDCVARAGQELVDAGPRCIRGADGSDVSYTFGGLNGPPVSQTIGQPAQPATVGLLLDQSAAFYYYEEDTREARLFTAKLFADRVLPDTALLLAAFAGDDPEGGYISLLPQAPVTFLPAANPGPFLSKAETFAELDGLAGLSGGIAPLYAAILSSIDFVASHALPGTRRMLVVMANGRDDACTEPAQCAALRAEIAARAAEKDVELVLQWPDYAGRPLYYWYGLPSIGKDGPGYEALRALAVDASAPLIVGSGVSHNALDLVQDLIEGEVAVEDLRVSLTSDLPGAFHTGATVVGELHGTKCAWECEDYSFPFAVQVP